MTAWIAYTIATSLLLGVAAWGAEAALRALGRPARGVWLGTLAASLLLPAYAAAGGPLPALLPFPAPFVGAAGAAATGATTTGAGALAAVASPSTAIALPPPGSNSADWFVAAWAAASATLAGLLLLLELRLRRDRRGWIEAVVAGVPVLVSRDVGPAVAGFVRGRIVLPAWALRLDPAVLRAMVAHETEHLRAGDTRLLLAGLAVICALPWNPVLWWQYRRLGLAVEVDCDARVLRALPDPRAYGLALLETARRRSRGALLHAALLRPRSFLRRRIEMMGLATGRRRTARALACSGVAALALAVAVWVDSPAQPEAGASGRPAGDAAATGVPGFEPAPDSPAVRDLAGSTLPVIRGVVVYVNSVELMRRDGDVRLEVEGDRVRFSDGPILWSELRRVEAPEPHWVASGRVRLTDPHGRGVVPPPDRGVLLWKVELRQDD
ncbi:MAG TPA: M56 family metallopeptidase [Longimicrobiales bacterium]